MRVAISVLTLAAVIGTNTAPLAAKTFSCPPYNGLPVGPNLLKNPDFDNAGPCGTFTWWWQLLSNCPPNYSAAAGWLVHSSNQNDYVSTQLVQPSTLPIGGGPSMMHILQRHGNEGGIYQQLPFGLQKFMASVWVFVTSGRVQLQSANGGPNSSNTKYGEWELLRICSDTADGDPASDNQWLVIYNQDTNGGNFLVDRAELKVLP